MAKFIVTGSEGFIGSNLIPALLECGHEVYRVDSKLGNHKTWIHEELADGVIHLGAQSSVPKSIEDSLTSTLNNVEATILAFEYARKWNVPVVYASSSAVFDDDNPDLINPSTPYAVDKYASELYAASYKKLHNVNSIGLRFFNVYGPHQHGDQPGAGVVSIFIDRLVKNLPIALIGGDQTRDFIYVGDIVDIIVNSIMGLRSGEFTGNSTINVGTREETSLASLLNQCMNVVTYLQGFPSSSIITHQNRPMADAAKSVCTTREVELLMTSKFTPLFEGLMDTATWRLDK